MAFATPEFWGGQLGAPTLQDVHTYCDPFVVMGWASPLLGSTTVGVCVTDAVRRIPAGLAQTALTVDHAVKGPVILGIGAGEIANYRPYGWDIDSPAARLRSATREIRRFLESSEPDDAGALVALAPPDRGHGPALWIAAQGPRGLALTGQYADGWIPTNIDVDTWCTARRAVEAAAREAGRPGAVTSALALDVVVQDTRAEAERLLAHPAIRQLCLMLPRGSFGRYGVDHPLGGSASEKIIPSIEGERFYKAALAVPDEIVRDHVVYGTVDDVVAAIKRFEGLEHVRLSNVGGVVRPGGGLERLLAVVAELQCVR